MPDFPKDVVDQINAHLGGFSKALGIRIVKASPDEIAAEMEIHERHHQPYGLVHGGVYASMIETLCSIGAALNVMADGRSAVGLENTSSFLRAVRSGTLRCTARPLIRGRRSHVWEGQIHDEQDRLVATGRVRMLVLESGAEADHAPLRLAADET